MAGTTHIPDTGNGATFSLAGTGFTGDWTEIGGNEQELDKIETSHLGTTGFKKFVKGDLIEPGEIEVTYLFYGTSVMPDGVSTLALPQLGKIDTLTLSYPDPTTVSGAVVATLVGTGFVTKRGLPMLKNNELMMGTLTWSFDGKTGPTFTGRTTV